MREILCSHGWKETSETTEAESIIVNSCTVTHQSDRKTRYFIRRLKKMNPDARIVLSGCYVEKKEPHELEQLPVDVILRNDEKENIAAVLGTLECDIHEHKHIASFKGHTRAFVKIQDGCNMKCSYCKVRIVRGPSRSRSKEEIIKEATALGEHGYREIVLTGIQLGAYGRDWNKPDLLVELLSALNEIKTIERIRLSSIEPFDVTEKLIAFIMRHEKMCAHLHIPLQSGDARVLKAMKRAYTPEKFVSLIETLRKAIPFFGLTTDVIVGFPGEDDEAFRNTLAVLEKTKPFKIHVFPFSPRKGTEAYNFSGRLSSSVIKEREAALLRLNERLFKKSLAPLVGSKQKILVEECVDIGRHTVRGHIHNYCTVEFEAGKECINSVVEAQIVSCERDYLRARLIA